MSNRVIIGFMTDWSLNSYYVGVCKAVIYSINPEALIVDLIHNVEKFEVYKNAHILYRASKDFPSNSVFNVVIDYGVGSKRKAIVLKTKEKNLIFVGPDNGIFSVVMENMGIKEIYEINNPKYFYKNPPSTTFHGRDIFSPVTAYISLGVSLEEFGNKLKPSDVIKFQINKPKIYENYIEGEIIFNDSFGNLETNIKEEDFWKIFSPNDLLELDVNGNKTGLKAGFFYSEVKKGELIAHPDSSGYIEIGVNQGNAKEKLNLTQLPAKFHLKKVR